MALVPSVQCQPDQASAAQCSAGAQSSAEGLTRLLSKATNLSPVGFQKSACTSDLGD
ncbi:MAG: hypothetical protein JWM45_2786, partial [Pseudonocardiales bacterium]|nr:hypothetical protein [Pseudonocardiales bacterium]